MCMRSSSGEEGCLCEGSSGEEGCVREGSSGRRGVCERAPLMILVSVNLSFFVPILFFFFQLKCS